MEGILNGTSDYYPRSSITLPQSASVERIEKKRKKTTRANVTADAIAFSRIKAAHSSSSTAPSTATRISSNAAPISATQIAASSALGAETAAPAAVKKHKSAKSVPVVDLVTETVAPSAVKKRKSTKAVPIIEPLAETSARSTAKKLKSSDAAGSAPVMGLVSETAALSPVKKRKSTKSAKSRPDVELVAEIAVPSAVKKRKVKSAKTVTEVEPGDSEPGPSRAPAAPRSKRSTSSKKASRTSSTSGTVRKRIRTTTRHVDESTRLMERAAKDNMLREQFRSNSDAMNQFLSSKWIPISELQRLEAEGVLTYKRGRFSGTEWSLIQDGLQTYKVSNNLDDDELLDVILDKNDHRMKYPRFWAEIAAQVPGRPVRYVKEAVRRYHDPRGRKGPWSPEEDEELLSAYDRYPQEWSKIALHVDRTELDCRNRFKNELRDAHTRNMGFWTEEETQNLIDAVEKAHAGLNPQLGTTEIPWDVVVKLMNGKRSRTQIRLKWTQLDRDGNGSQRVKLDRATLIARLRSLNIQQERHIMWPQVRGGRDGDSYMELSHVRLGPLRSVWFRLKSLVPNREGMPFDVLLDEIERQLAQPPTPIVRKRKSKMTSTTPSKETSTKSSKKSSKKQLIPRSKSVLTNTDSENDDDDSRVEDVIA